MHDFVTFWLSVIKSHFFVISIYRVILYYIKINYILYIKIVPYFWDPEHNNPANNKPDKTCTLPQYCCIKIVFYSRKICKPLPQIIGRTKSVLQLKMAPWCFSLTSSFCLHFLLTFIAALDSVNWMLLINFKGMAWIVSPV